MSILNCLIIEDEKPASELLKGYVDDVPWLSLAGVCEDVIGATQILNETKIDIIFLDINLPKINGIHFLKNIQGKYGVILTTAYHDYAVQGFELDASDYLLKPVTFERFLKAVNKTRERLKTSKPLLISESEQDYFFVKADNKYEKINKPEILYVEGLQNYITIQTFTKKVVTYSTLKSIETYLSEKEFLRVQKSFIVSISKIDRIDGDDVIIGKTVIPISRALKDEVLKTILNNRLYKFRG